MLKQYVRNKRAKLAMCLVIPVKACYVSAALIDLSGGFYILSIVRVLCRSLHRILFPVGCFSRIVYMSLIQGSRRIHSSRRTSWCLTFERHIWGKQWWEWGLDLFRSSRRTCCGLCFEIHTFYS